MKKKIVVLVSGKGSNAKNIDRYFRENYGYGITTLVSSKQNPDLEEWAEKHGVSFIQTDKSLKVENTPLWKLPEVQNADVIVLAGFLKKIPGLMITETNAPIINIHPALLPSYGGKGMYGANVHKAVLASDDRKSGITIHHVNENYDEGDIILQKAVDISENETIDSLQSKIHQLEYKYYPKVIQSLLYS